MSQNYNENEVQSVLELFERSFGWLPASLKEIPIGVCWEGSDGEVRQWNGSAFVPIKGKQTRTPQQIRDAQLSLTGPPPPVPPGARASIPQAPGPVSPSTPEPTLAERLKKISQKLSGAVTTSDYEDYVCLADFQAAIAELDEIAGEVEKLENYDY